MKSAAVALQMEQLVSGMGWDGKGTNPVHLAGHKRLYACEACPSAVGPARFHASLCGGVGQLVDCIASFCYPHLVGMKYCSCVAALKQ
jgi:hypothetical protein